MSQKEWGSEERRFFFSVFRNVFQGKKKYRSLVSPPRAQLISECTYSEVNMLREAMWVHAINKQLLSLSDTHTVVHIHTIGRQLRLSHGVHFTLTIINKIHGNERNSWQEGSRVFRIAIWSGLSKRKCVYMHVCVCVLKGGGEGDGCVVFPVSQFTVF